MPSWVQKNSYLMSKKSETWNRYGLQILRTLISNLTCLQPQSPCLYSLNSCEMSNRSPIYLPCENTRTSQPAFIAASRKASCRQLTLCHGSASTHQMPQDIAGSFYTQSPLHSTHWSLVEPWVMIPNLLSGQSEKLILRAVLRYSLKNHRHICWSWFEKLCTHTTLKEFSGILKMRESR